MLLHNKKLPFSPLYILPFLSLSSALYLISYIALQKDFLKSTKDKILFTLIFLSIITTALSIATIYLINNKKSQAKNYNYIDEKGNTPLTKILKKHCISYWNLKKFKSLLDNGTTDPNFADSNGNTPLNVLLSKEYLNNKDLKALKLLLNNDKTDPNLADVNGNTPLTTLLNKEDLRSNDLEALKLLLSNDKTDLNLADVNGNTPLTTLLNKWSLNESQLEALKLLLSNPKTDPNLADKYDSTPLAIILNKTFLYFSYSKGLEAFKLLLDNKRTDPNLATKDGNTPLAILLNKEHLHENRLKLLKLLLDNKRTDPNVVDKKDNNPLITILNKNYLNKNDIEALVLLIDHSNININSHMVNNLLKKVVSSINYANLPDNPLLKIVKSLIIKHHIDFQISDEVVLEKIVNSIFSEAFSKEKIDTIVNPQVFLSDHLKNITSDECITNLPEKLKSAVCFNKNEKEYNNVEILSLRNLLKDIILTMKKNQDFAERLYCFTRITCGVSIDKETGVISIDEKERSQHKENFDRLYNYLKYGLFDCLTIQLTDLTHNLQFPLPREICENTTPYFLNSDFFNELSFHYYIFSIVLEYIKTNITILQDVNFNNIKELDELVDLSNIFKFYHHKKKFGDIKVTMIDDTPPDPEQYYELELKTPFEISSELEEINLQDQQEQDINL